MPSPEANDQMTFWDHLSELRTRIIRCLVILVAVFAVTYSFRFRLMTLAQQPFMTVYKAHAIAQARILHQPPPTVFEPFAYTSLTEPFFSLMRLSLWASVFLASPLLFHQVWGFIRPGLYQRERRHAIPFVVVTSGCFLAGAAFAYWNAFKFLGDILFQEALNAGLRTNLHLEDYLDLFIYTVVGTGIMFELPVLIYFLARFRLITARWMLKYLAPRRHRDPGRERLPDPRGRGGDHHLLQRGAAGPVLHLHPGGLGRGSKAEG